MNNERRKKIRNCLDLIEQVKIILEEVRNDEYEAYENLPEGLQESEKGEKMQENIDIMEAQNEALDDVVAELEEVL